MAHANGRIFIDTTSTPHVGISMSDMNAVLGTSGYGDIGAFIQYAAANDLIRVWAKYKPERNSLLHISEADRQDNYFGLSIPIMSSAAAVASFVDDFSNGWLYLAPRGKGAASGQDEWYRYLDFNGYNHYANCFVNSADKTLPSSYTVGIGGTGVTFHLGINAGANLAQDAIGITDLKLGGSEGTAFSGLYFGLLFKDGSTYKLVTSANTLGTDVSTYGGGEVFIGESGGSLSGITTGTQYMVYPVLSLISHATLSSLTQQDRLVGLPTSAFSFKAQSAAATQNIGINNPTANVGIRGRLDVSFELAMAGTPTSMTANYVIYSATGVDDTTGTQLATGSASISTSSPEAVSRSLNVTIPTWVRIYAYNANNNAVNATAYVEVSQVPTPD